MTKLYTFLILFILSCSISQAHNNDGKSTSPFIKNKGQWNNTVFYQAAVYSGLVYFEKDAFHYQVNQIAYKHAGVTVKPKKTGIQAFKARFINSNKEVTIEGNHPSETYYNYYLGNDPNKWASKVPAYENLEYHNLYTGIGLKVYFQGGAMKYDYVVASHADVKQIQIRYEGIEQPKIKHGELILKHELGTLIEAKPYAYQIVDGKAREVKCKYTLDENKEVSFLFPNGYDENLPLIIDPKLVFSTYSGSPSSNFGMTSTFDSEGNGYVGGTIFAAANIYTNSTGYFQSKYNGGSSDIVISKFNSVDGSQLMYSTYLGGNGAEAASSMIVDHFDNLIILGVTGSSNFPITSNAYKTKKDSSVSINLSGYYQNYRTGNDIVITKLSKDGTSLLASTFFGGNSSDGLNFDMKNIQSENSRLVYNHGDFFRGEIQVDSADNIYIGTSTHSIQIDSALNKYSGSQDGIIAKFNTNLSQLYWTRYLGGSEDDAIYSLKIIGNNKILVGGGTRSFTNFPTTNNSYKPTSGGGRADGFISIISADGKTLEKSTFIGTPSYDQVYFVEYDRFNNIYALGTTKSLDFPIKNAPIANDSVGQFIVKLDPNLDSLMMSLTFGDTLASGNINISPTAFLVDRCLNIYASGWGGSIAGTGEGTKTLPAAMPLRNAFQSTTDKQDFYLYVINRDADSLLYGSFFGGAKTPDHVDGGTSRFDKNGIVYQSVCASCGYAQVQKNDFPTTANAYAKSKGVPVGTYGCNSALFKYDFEIAPHANFKLSQQTICLKFGDTVFVKIENHSKRGNKTTWDFYGTKVVSNFKDTTIFFTMHGTFKINQLVEDTICVLGNFETKMIYIRPDNINLNLKSVDSVICYTDSIHITAFNGGFANQYTWSKNRDFNPAVINSDSTHVFHLKAGQNTLYIKANNTITNACEKIDSITITYLPVEAGFVFNNDSICKDSPIQLSSTTQNVDTFSWNFGDGNTNSKDPALKYNYANTGNYLLQFIYNNSICPRPDTLSSNIVVQKNDLKFGVFSDSVYCGDGDFDISVNSLGTAKTYLWSNYRDFTDTLNPNLSDSSIKISKIGDYKFYIKISDNICTLVDSLEASYINYALELPPLTDDSVCAPYQYQMNPVIIGTDSFRINYGDGRFTKIDSTPNIKYSTEGVYNIELIGSNKRCNRKDTVSQQISVFKAAKLASLMDTIICFGDNFKLIANSFGTANQFYWDVSPKFTSPLNNPLDSTVSVTPSTGLNTYYIKAKNVICEVIDTINITAEEVLIQLDPYNILCVEDTLDLTVDVLNGTPPLQYLWSPNNSIINGQGTKTIKTAPKNDIIFTIIVSDNINCKAYDTTDIDVKSPTFITVEITASVDSAYKGQKVKLKSNRQSGNLLYYWEPKELMDNPNAAEPTITISKTTTITLTIVDINTGCTAEDELRLKKYELNCKEPEIFIPSAFTPNNDGQNDVLYVRSNILETLDLKIYNRWGELVFETDDPNKGWDGTFKGEQLPPAVYVYYIESTCVDGQKFFKKGNITLIR